MSLRKDDKIVLNNKHSESNGEISTVTQVIESMFGEPTYTISLDESQGVGIAQDQLEAVDGDDADEADEE